MTGQGVDSSVGGHVGGGSVGGHETSVGGGRVGVGGQVVVVTVGHVITGGMVDALKMEFINIKTMTMIYTYVDEDASCHSTCIRDVTSVSTQWRGGTVPSVETNKLLPSVPV